MRRIISFLCILLAISCFSVNDVCAKENDKVNSEISDLFFLEDEIINKADELHKEEYVDTLSVNGLIDFSKAYKVYVDVNLFEKEQLSKVEMEELIEGAAFVWRVPVYYEDSTCIVEVSKGVPYNKKNEHLMTEEEKKISMENVGKWQVVSYFFYEGTVDQRKEMNDILDSVLEGYEDYTFLGGVPGIGEIIAAVVQDGDVSKIVPLEADIVSRTDGKTRMQKREVYNYSDMRAIALEDVNEMEKTKAENPNENVYGGKGYESSVSVAGIVIMGVMVTCLMGYLVYKKRKCEL